ncbi:Abi family protein [Listeria monocytogenes]|uniref:Abi family protein n=1 Tax=Listeria TaxID=1637 RepID=UPI0011EABAE1|nr:MULTISPECIES: Abi family protein [Listeria]EHD1589210.1 Abi family protein [Listeria monocytogenes]EHK4067720.1 Abi family protein [Listeria monocytogenes]MBC1339372.1 Abi family protein [Listeria innocua]MBC1353541.1 Abi family protein [Listeria innocua]TYV33136.1 Abi family protein [Listeria monocytogenes]
MKPFKTHIQQLKILRDRNLNTGNGSKTMRYLEQENYYNVINGYKELFLKKDIKGCAIQPETFIDNAHIDEIYALFCFDRELRNLYVRYLLKFESNIKSVIAYRFSEEFKNQNAYLDIDSYTKSTKETKKVLSTISIISNIIASKFNGGNSINHYIDKHGGVPLWVLVNYLTIGNISYFYQVLQDSLKNKVTRDFNKQYNRRNPKGKLFMQPEDLASILKMANLFRNVCAHEERLYSYKVSDVRIKYFSSYFQINPNHLKENNLFALTVILRAVLSKGDAQSLHRGLRDLNKEYSRKFISLQFGEILRIMGFPQNWDKYMEKI